MTSRVRTVLLGALLLQVHPATAAAGGDRNACGCYGDGAGTCYCDKGARCGCPGECEPKGCEQQRERQFEKEVETETRRAKDLERASEGKGPDTETPAPPPPPPRPPASTHARARQLTAREQHELARLLTLYVAGDPARQSMSSEEILSNLSATAGDGSHRHP